MSLAPRANSVHVYSISLLTSCFSAPHSILTICLPIILHCTYLIFFRLFAPFSCFFCVARFRCQGFDKISCGYIGSSCNSDICWVRDKTEKKCEDNRVTPIINCAAYQATRAMTIIGTIFLIAGSSILVVAICIASRVLPSSGAICTFIGGLFLMIGFSIFYSEIFSPLSDIVDVSWSLILLIVAWPLAIIAGLMGMTAMFAGSKGAERADDEDSD